MGEDHGDLLRDGSLTPNLHSGRQGHSGGTRLGMRETRPLVRTSTKLMNVKSVTVLARPDSLPVRSGFAKSTFARRSMNLSLMKLLILHGDIAIP